MQRQFITYPDGASGIGLLLLRLAVCTTLANIEPGSRWDALLAPIVLGGSAMLAIALITGVLTRIAAVLVGGLHVLSVVGSGLSGTADLAFIAQALALALIGPGAYSLDSRLFGRRLIFESRSQANRE